MTGNVIVKNDSQAGISFNIFSGKLEALANFFNFETGQNTGILKGQSSRDFLVNRLNNTTTGTGLIVPVSFTSDFGKFTQNCQLTFKKSYRYSLSLIGPEILFSTGIYDYDILFSESFGQNLTTEPFGLHFSIGNIDGYSGYADFNTQAGGVSGSITGFNISNKILGTGKLTGLLSNSGKDFNTVITGNMITQSLDNLLQEDSSLIKLQDLVISTEQKFLKLSGYSTGFEGSYVGAIPAPVYSGETFFATGDMSFPFLLASSGIVTGLNSSIMRNISGGYSFTTGVTAEFSGQRSISHRATTGIIMSGNDAGGAPVVTIENQIGLFSEPLFFEAPSDQENSITYANEFSGFSTGQFEGASLFPANQAGFGPIATISGYKFIDETGPFIGTGTGIFDVTGIFPMDINKTGGYVENGYVLDLSDSIITGNLSGLLTEDINSTGLIARGTGITGADVDQFIESTYSGIFSGFSTGTFLGTEARIPLNQAGLTTNNTISGLKISGLTMPYTLGSFSASGDGFFNNITGINQIPADASDNPLFDFGYLILEIDKLTGIATGLLPEDPNQITAVYSGFGISGIELVPSGGFLTGSGVVTGEIPFAEMSGFTGINFTHHFIAQQTEDPRSGLATGPSSHNITEKSIDVPDVSMTGNYFYEFASDRIDYFENIITVTGTSKVSGRIDFTGKFTYSGTGVYVHREDITGIGYTGLGIMGAYTTGTKDIVFDGEFTGRKLTNTGSVIENSGSFTPDGERTYPFNYGEYSGIPVSSVYDQYNRFNISGESGIALVCDHTNRIEPNDVIPNDFNRSYKNHPVWLKYSRNPQANAGNANEGFYMSVSPRYFLSGDGIFKSTEKDWYMYTMYTGEPGNLTYMDLKGAAIETSDNFDKAMLNDGVRRFDIAGEDDFPLEFSLLITKREQSTQPSGFYFVYFEEEKQANLSYTPTNNKFFTSASSRGYSHKYTTLDGFSGAFLSTDEIHPTGNTTNQRANSFEEDEETNMGFLTGLNSFETGFTMTGFTGNLKVQGTGMTGVGDVNAIGKFSGTLEMVQDFSSLDPRFQNDNLNETFTQMTGDFNGIPSHNTFEIETGQMILPFYLNQRRVRYNIEIDKYETNFYTNLAFYRLNGSVSTSVEQISGDVKKYCDKLGYTVYYSPARQTLGITSLPHMTYPVGAALAFGAASNQGADRPDRGISNLDRKLVTRQSGGLFTLIENGVETATQGTNLPFLGQMTGSGGFTFDSPAVTGNTIVSSGVPGDVFRTGFTGFSNSPSTLRYGFTQTYGGILNSRITKLVSTGVSPATGFGTGRDIITVLAAQKSGSFIPAEIDMNPFTGIGLMLDGGIITEGGFIDS